MKVMLVVTDAERGGAPNRFASLARAARTKTGIEFLFVSLAGPGPVSADLRDAGIDVGDLALAKKYRFPASLRTLRNLIRSFEPDVIQSALWHANVLVRIAALGTRVPVVNSHESVDDEKSAIRVITDRFTQHLAERHTAVCDAVKERVVVRDRVPAHRVEVIRIGKDSSRWTRASDGSAIRAALEVPPNGRVLGWSGRMHPVKRLDLLINAFAMLPEEWTLLLVGDGEEKSSVVRLAREQRVEERVRLVGSQEDVKPYLEAMDVFCLTSRWEGLPTALIEAMAVGIPSVAVDVGCVGELIESGRTGILVAPDPSAEEVADAIRTAYGRTDIASEGAAKIATDYREETTLQQHVDLWESCRRSKSKTVR